MTITVFGLALHVAVREGWSLRDLADAMQTKLDLRFDTVLDAQD